MLLTFADVFVFYAAYLLSGSGNCCYSASTAVRGARLRNRAFRCGNLLWRFAVSCGYRSMREMIVGVKCKLTDVEIACHFYVHCVSHCRFRVSKPNKKRNPILKKLPCLFISLLSRLGPWDTKSVL